MSHQSPPPPSWTDVAEQLRESCPSPSLCHEVVKTLERVERIGKLGDRHAEFKRVYRFLQWNEPTRVRLVVDALLPKAKGPKPQIVVKHNAWKYVNAVLDEWITQARIFYLVSGILECTLRARINTRMSDILGPEWPDVPGAVPAKLHELADRAARDGQLAQIHDLVHTPATGSLSPAAQAKLVEDIQGVLGPPATNKPRRGDKFVSEMTFGGLRMFFSKNEFDGWEGKFSLKNLFSGRDGTATLPSQDKVVSVLRRLNDARNAVAHYTPREFMTFEKALFAAAELADWLGENLQHVYGSIDTRHSTELSILLGPLRESFGWYSRPEADRCAEPGCTGGAPLEWLMDRAPRDPEDAKLIALTRACPQHRIEHRVRVHRPKMSA
jgi:hypothetical protein